MKKANRIKNDGISLRVTHVAMVVCAVIISLLLIFSTYQSSSVFSKLSKATGNYIVRQEAAHDLMEASDYLTEMVQRFTLEGDTQYLDNYFEEAFVSKRREASITSMSENNAEEAMLQQLQAAMDESMSLMYREYYAMKLVIDAKEIRDTHEQIRAIELARSRIQELSGNLYHESGADFAKEVSAILSVLTDGRYTRISLDEKNLIRLNTPDKLLSVDQVSYGTMQQVYFALRLASAGLLSGGSEVPILLDEPFAMYDEKRLERALRILAGSARQVILFSCQTRELDLLEKMGLA